MKPDTSKVAELLLAFDSVILPDGKTRQIEEVVQSAEGLKTDPTDEQGTLHASGNQGEETVSGATRGAVLGGVTGAVSGRELKGLGVGAVIGSTAGALIGLFKKGDDAELKKGTTVTIQLKSDVRFVRLPPRIPSMVPMSQ
jgi:outer membrane lipoprotein SlyB